MSEAVAEETVVTVAFYVCPTSGCGNYYGSRTMPDLAKAEIEPPVDGKDAYAKTHDGNTIKFTRDQCPDCRQRGKAVARVLRTMAIAVEIPHEQAPTQEDEPVIEPGDGIITMWRPVDRNEWEPFRGQEGGIVQTFIPGEQ